MYLTYTYVMVPLVQKFPVLCYGFRLENSMIKLYLQCTKTEITYHVSTVPKLETREQAKVVVVSI